PARDHVRLLEVRGRGVEDDRLPFAELVAHHAREAAVPPLGHPGRVLYRSLLVGVEIDVEVLGLQHLVVELLVLDLVLAEVLGRRRVRRESERGRGEEGRGGWEEAGLAHGRISRMKRRRWWARTRAREVRWEASPGRVRRTRAGRTRRFH